MEGKGHKDGLHVEVERLARIVFARKVQRINASETIKAQEDIFGSIPDKLRKSATFDNGTENVQHTRLNSFGIQTYFTDPYSAWQKGSVENIIGIIRRYFPKGGSGNKQQT